MGRLALVDISCSIDINRRPEEVFLWVKDPEKAMVWMTSVSKGEILHQTPDLVGTTFRETVEDEGRGTELHGMIIGYTPDESISFHLSGDYNVVDVEHRVEEIEGGTRLTTDANVRFKGLVWVMSLFMGATFKKKAIEQMQAEFARLKELCERQGEEA